MEIRKLGRTGLKVSAICFGGNVLGWTADESTSSKVLNAFVDAGGNFIDTANTYSRWVPGHIGGESETILGKWMRDRGNRAQIVVATKCSGQIGNGPNDRGASRAHIVSQVELSLRRLQTDYIDLYQIHYDDPDTPVEETMWALDDLVRQGKVRYVGASNTSAWRFCRSLWESDKRGFVRYQTLQPLYNLIDRSGFEREMEPLCVDQDVAVLPYSSLASGFLSGKYRAGADLPSSGRAVGVQRRYMNERGFRVIAAVQEVAHALDATATQVSLAWLLARRSVTAPIVSATSVDQLVEIAGSVRVKLSPEAIAKLDSASGE